MLTEKNCLVMLSLVLDTEIYVHMAWLVWCSFAWFRYHFSPWSI